MTESAVHPPVTVYPVKPAFAADTRITRADYERLYAQSLQQPDAFWGKVAERLDWMKAPTKIKDTSFDLKDFRIRWYADGELNASVNCLDRHLATRGDKTALVFEPDSPDTPAEQADHHRRRGPARRQEGRAQGQRRRRAEAARHQQRRDRAGGAPHPCRGRHADAARPLV